MNLVLFFLKIFDSISKKEAHVILLLILIYLVVYFKLLAFFFFEKEHETILTSSSGLEITRINVQIKGKNSIKGLISNIYFTLILTCSRQ